MPAFRRDPLRDFLALSQSELTGILTRAYAASGFTSLRSSQVFAWLADLLALQSAMGQVLSGLAAAAEWTVLLEFEIPRKEKRIDVVLLAGETIVLLELKSGLDGSSLQQAEDYGLLLHYFHQPSHGRRIYPLVVSPQPQRRRVRSQMFLPIPEAAAFWVQPVETLAWDELPHRLLQIGEESNPTPINAEQWEFGAYAPVPGIIDAARALQSGLNVREIAHSLAARHDVDQLTDFIHHIVQEAKQQHHHTICFVTGVPGSGKTLVGLNLAFAKSQSREPIHFMSGTGPLVMVLQAVLARNHSLRTGARAADAVREAKTLIENVHVFAREYSERDTQRPPSNHVVIFDEAQRAWNREQNLRKFNRDYSEPEMLLRIMERHDDWSVVIALVGGGQEINSGEAGLGAWGHALLHTTTKPWRIYASPEAISGSEAVAFSRLFPGGAPSDVRVKPQLHLDVAVRSLKADKYAQWANHVIEGEQERAAEVARDLTFPIYLTRSLSDTRRLLMENTRGEARCGLVGSSKAARLRAEGLEPDSSFHAEYSWHHWYLSGPQDTRSSYALEVFTTEFEIQGLELDWIGLCWGGDFVWSDEQAAWLTREFRVANSRWSALRADDRRLYRKNAYRVLLTRARQGIVLFVPSGDRNDPTRSPAEFDSTARFLLSCGARFPAISETGEIPVNAPISVT